MDRPPTSIPGLRPVPRRVNRTKMMRVIRDDSGSLGFSLSPSLEIIESTPFARSFGVHPNQVVTHVNSIEITSRDHFKSVTSSMKSIMLTVRTANSSSQNEDTFTINLLPPRRRSIEKRNQKPSLRVHHTMPISSSKTEKKRGPKKMAIKIDKSLSVMHNMSRIEPCLYLGGQDGAAMSLDTLKSYGISHIVNCTLLCLMCLLLQEALCCQIYSISCSLLPLNISTRTPTLEHQHRYAEIRKSF